MNILLVEDDTSLGFLLSEYLETEGFQVKLCRDGASGWQSFMRHNFDLCILDVMMPNMDGFTLAKKIRSKSEQIPFVFLTAKSLKADKLKGFELGAEDYITKPFDEEELLCRLQVIMRRNGAEEAEDDCPKVFKIGAYHFDYSRQELTIDTNTHRLTEKENEVLRLLCLKQNQILKREEAVEEIYGKRDYFLGRSFDVFISRLRKLLNKDPNISIDNVFRVGFILNVK